ncbi:DUF1285 domain-containing protein [Marinomonas sp. THO17]|uniref:DUF1285 domain-containing protein n=1 Tax=Marinomonas sp. THO17 TaxID=3149048 RepID=UPI00336BD3E0
MAAMIDLKHLPSNNDLPPVDTWKPDFCGDMDMLIKANGDWIHEGGKIHRSAMVKLFSRILWHEDNEYFLVTPVEKVRIRVEDAPFLVNRWRTVETPQGAAIEFTTTTDDVMVLGVDTDLFMAPFYQKEQHQEEQLGGEQQEEGQQGEGQQGEGQQGEERPYIDMRYGMKALIARNVFYALAEQLQPVATQAGSGQGIISAGKSYLLLKED